MLKFTMYTKATSDCHVSPVSVTQFNKKKGSSFVSVPWIFSFQTDQIFWKHHLV